MKNGLMNKFILFLIFIVPLIWSKYLNANYFSAKFFIVYLVAALTLFVTSEKIKIPKLPRILSGLLIAMMSLHFTSLLVSQKWTDIYYMFKFFSFAWLVYYFYLLDINLEAFIKKYTGVFVVVVGLIVIFAMNDFYHIRIENDDIKSGFFLGSFGNVNMMAEFLVISWPLVFYWSQIKCKTPLFLKYTLMFFWIFFLLYCRSRSAWMGLGLWSLWVLWQKKVTKKEVIIFVSAFVIYQLSILAPTTARVVEDVKQNSFGERLHLYKSTIELIKDHPLGVGVGQFMTEIVPYLVNSEFRPMEYVFFDQPHSEILKWASEFGWFGLVIAILLLGFIFINLTSKYLKYEQQKLTSPVQFFLTGSFLALIPQILFQFPFENPATLLYLSFLFAVWISTFAVAQEIALNFKKRIIFFVLALIGVAHAFAFVTSILMETSHNNDIELIEQSCDFYPININACFNKSHFLLMKENYIGARHSLDENLNKFPFHAGFLRLLPIYLKNNSTDQKSCEAVLVYNSIYSSQVFFNKDILNRCNQFKMPITFYNPEQFKEVYLKWKNTLF